MIAGRAFLSAGVSCQPPVVLAAQATIGRMRRPWTRRDRSRAEIAVLSRGFIEIRTIAYKPEVVGDPAAALERIRMIADACHNLPGAARVHRRGSHPDPFAWAWQTASSDKREWLAGAFQSLGLDTADLDAIPVGQSSAHFRQTRRRIRVGPRKRAGHGH